MRIGYWTELPSFYTWQEKSNSTSAGSGVKLRLTKRRETLYAFRVVIRSFAHKGLQELFETGKSRKVRPDQIARILRRLDALDRALEPGDLDLPGFGFHVLRGLPKRWSVMVNGPWRITFEWIESEPWNVDLEQYH